ncbi:verrucotoxin subunit beta-like [Silurus meridionalis]|uniref:verrucotoxin subunit beta-like n=1 Tax=Silurus meridionalis TaxID=175797 RepID=UPI001EE9DFA7|nr:verrucotoxin subunit beta-like [Silurus meridionalis]
MNVEGELKLSLMGGIVPLSGSAKYFNDTKKSFIQERLTLHYRTTTKFEQLSMDHLGKGKMGHHGVFKHDVATHVVTAVLYGANAYFVFDRKKNLSKKTTNAGVEGKIDLEKLKNLLFAGASAKVNMDENEKAALKQLSCTFYGDFNLPLNPATFDEAMKVYTDLPKLLGENGKHAVPVRVWLYPLVKLESKAAKLVRTISTDVIRAVESVIEALNVTNMKCGDLLQDTVAKSFTTFYKQVQDFQKFCYEYKQDFMKKLGFLLPDIRGGKTDISAVSDLLQAHEKSPFNTRDLQQWITEKEKKSIQIKTVLKQLSDLGAEVNDDIHKYLLDLNVEKLVAYAFNCLQYSDLLLTKQKIYLDPSTMENTCENTPDPDFQEKSLTSDELMHMKNNLQIFKNLITFNNKCESTKFIVQSLNQTSNGPCSCILVYENGCSEPICFTPPSKPECPKIECVTDHNVTVKMGSPCAATLQRKLLYKMKLEKDWKSQPVDQDVITLTDLKEGTDYEIKCGAVGKLDYMVESDINTVTTTLSAVKPQKEPKSTESESTQQKIETESAESSEYLSATAVSGNSSDDEQINESQPRYQELKSSGMRSKQ